MGLFNNQLLGFGLDISGSSVKMMQLEKKGSKFGVKGLTDLALSKGMVVNDVVVDSKSFSALIRQGMEKCQVGQITTNYAVVSLPESKSFVRVIQIPLMSDAEAD